MGSKKAAKLDPAAERRRVRRYANHLGLMLRGSAGAFKLVERYGKKEELGTYRSVATLERRIKWYGEQITNGERSY
ncbi:hypothetical protein UP10_14425 [Bradyrhizobium sp. LTSPM299]|nr:hypothetical protein UP10_14425 [Bradyrhizobium sp. LTSPM299]